MSAVLVDRNAVLGVLTEVPRRAAWLPRRSRRPAEKRILVINPIIYSEVSIGFHRVEELDAALPEVLACRRPRAAPFVVIRKV